MRVAAALILVAFLLTACVPKPLYERADIVLTFPVLSVYGAWPGLLPEPTEPGEYEVWVAVRFEHLKPGQHTLTVEVLRDGQLVTRDEFAWEFKGQPVRYVLIPVQAKWEAGTYTIRVRLDNRKTVGTLRFVIEAPTPPSAPQPQAPPQPN